MILEQHEELELNCSMSIDYLNQLSSLTEIDEDTLCCLVYCEDYVGRIGRRLYQMQKEFNADSLCESCEKLSVLLNTPPVVGLPFEQRKRARYVITPEAANISQHIDQLNEDFDIVWERLQDGAEIVRAMFDLDNDLDEPRLVAKPDTDDWVKMWESFCASTEKLVEIEQRLKELRCFEPISHVQKQILCNNCQTEGKSLDDDFSNELFLPE